MMRTPPPLWALDSEGHSRLLGSVAKLAALAQAAVGVSKTFCFWAWGPVRVGKLLGFLLCCPAFSVPLSPSFPFSPPVSRACPCSIACRGYACSSGHLVGQNSCCFCGPGGPSGCKLRVFFSTRCSAMWWACFSSELFVSTMLRYIQATTGCSSKSVDLTSLSYRLPGGS